MKEYWVDVETTGSYEDENEETLIDRTSGEGSTDGFHLGLQPVDDTISQDPGEDTDRDMEDVDDGASTKTRGSNKNGIQKECALEAALHCINHILVQFELQ